MSTYTYDECLQNSYQMNWRISDVLGGRHFDATRRWLPLPLSAASRVTCLTPTEKVKLTQVEMGAYAHLFGFLEEFIAPTMVTLARSLAGHRRDAFDALTNFAAEEVKHMTLFREVRASVDATVGFPLGLLPGAPDVTRAVLSKHTGAVLLLTAAIEWLTQLHYLSCFADDEALDPLTKQIFRAHWLEESQHARMDHLETLRVFGGMSAAEKDRAVDDLIELVGTVDGLLQGQAARDVDNFQRCLWRRLGAADQAEIRAAVLAAKRYTFIESGVTHPNFLDLFTQVTTPAQQHKVRQALGAVLAPAA
jgi:P-aminobenzoate N-oxygenase AurF